MVLFFVNDEVSLTIFMDDFLWEFMICFSQGARGWMVQHRTKTAGE